MHSFLDSFLDSHAWRRKSNGEIVGRARNTSYKEIARDGVPIHILMSYELIPENPTDPTHLTHLPILDSAPIWNNDWTYIATHDIELQDKSKKKRNTSPKLSLKKKYQKRNRSDCSLPSPNPKLFCIYCDSEFTITSKGNDHGQCNSCWEKHEEYMEQKKREAYYEFLRDMDRCHFYF